MELVVVSFIHISDIVLEIVVFQIYKATQGVKSPFFLLIQFPF